MTPAKRPGRPAAIPTENRLFRPAARSNRHTSRLTFRAVACLTLAVCLTGGLASADDADDTIDSASESFQEMSEASETKKSSRRKGVKASASASGMMSGSAGGRSMGQGFGGGQGQGSGSQMGPAFGGAGSNAALQGQMKLRVSISTDDDEDEPKPDTLDPYVPGGPGTDDADDAQVMRRMEGGRRITTIERAGETITITDSPTRIVVHRLDRSVDPPASSYVAATSPKALAAKDPAAYDLFDRYVVKTPAQGQPRGARPGMPNMPGIPNMPGRPARAGLPEMPRTGIPRMDRMLDGFLNDQQ
jgi:hypothetical protein